MVSAVFWRTLLAQLLFLTFAISTSAKQASSASASTAPPTSASTSSIQTSNTAAASASSSSQPPDVLLNVPQLSVGRIELTVDDLQADINLNAKVAGLVTLNAGVAVSIQKVNLTIVDVDAQLELIVRLGHLVDIVDRVFESLDLNPMLISIINNATSAVGGATDALGNVTSALDKRTDDVDGLLGSITQAGTTLSFLVDDLGNIVQQISGGASSIVGNYSQNMTETGDAQNLGSGLTQKTYSYLPLGAIVDIVFNKAGQVVQATVQKTNSGGGGDSSASDSSASSTSP